MKRSKTLAIVALLLAAISILGSCGGSRISVGEKTYTASAELSALKGGSTYGTSSYCKLFYITETSGGRYVAFDRETNTVLPISFSNTAELDYSVTVDRFLIKAVQYNKTTEQSTVSVYGTDGTLLLTKNGSSVSTVWSSSGDSVILDGTIYRYDSDKHTAVKVSELSALSDIDSFTHLGDKYIYKLSSSTVRVYDLSGTAAAYYKLPSYASGGALYLLNGGDILVQYAVVTDQQSSHYDYVSGGTRYELCTYRFDVSRNKTVKLSCKYLIQSVTVPTEENAYAAYVGSVKNYATGYKIEDKRVDTSASALCELELSNSGRVTHVLSTDGTHTVTPLYGGRYLRTSDITGVTEILNSRFKTVKKITAPITSTGRYLLINKTVYDTALKEVLVLGSNDTVYASFSDGAMIIQRTVNDTDRSYILLTLDGQQKYISAQTNATSETVRAYEEYGYYYISSGDDYRYYNLNGDLLLTTAAGFSLTPEFTTEGGLVLSGYSLEGNHYYLFSTPSTAK